VDDKGDVDMLIREYEPRDWPHVWAVLEPVFQAGETYAVPRDISSDEARLMWTAEPKRAFVAVDEADGRVLGTYFLRPNADGPGAHVCNCGYVVAVQARGRSVASLMCQHSQERALALGFRAMQFNLVVSTNAALRLWQNLGFAIVGTIPAAFNHPSLGLVDAHVMHKFLKPSAGH
jgi:L-amino acid N-acyltransferase YncA